VRNASTIGGSSASAQGEAGNVRGQPAVELGREPGIAADLGEVVGANTQDADGLFSHREITLPCDAHQGLGENQSAGTDAALGGRVAHDAIEHDVGHEVVRHQPRDRRTRRDFDFHRCRERRQHGRLRQIDQKWALPGSLEVRGGKTSVVVGALDEAFADFDHERSRVVPTVPARATDQRMRGVFYFTAT
jgi:hypothetical protein